MAPWDVMTSEQLAIVMFINEAQGGGKSAIIMCSYKQGETAIVVILITKSHKHVCAF